MSANRYFLKGIDYFQLLIDHHNKKKGGRGHEARLAIFTREPVDVDQLRFTINQNEICKKLQSVRLSKTFGLGYPSITFNNLGEEIPIVVKTIDGTEIPEQILNHAVNVYNMPPLHIHLLQFSNGTGCVLFAFHHILFDFAGVQSFISSLCGEGEVPLMPPVEKKRAFMVRFQAFFSAVFFTFREANANMTVEVKKLPKSQPFNIDYREICFTSDEKSKIIENVSRYKLFLNQGMYFLSGVSKGMHDEVFSKQKKHNFIWVPLPVNVRKKGTTPAVLFNGLSFLFYKLRPIDLQTMQTTTTTIREQMVDQMRKKMPEAFIDFADGYWYMPMPFYAPMLYLPSWGKLSSFSFSVLGDTFKSLNTFLGQEVTNVINYPSNSIAPGVTFLFYEFRGQLRLMTSWVKGQYSPTEQTVILQRVKENLLDSKS